MNQSYRYLSMIALLVGSLYASQAIADDEIDALLEMDLEELTVSVASKKEESIKDAPGIINVITRRDIETYGAATLHDVFRRLPNVFPYSSVGHNSRILGVRAQQQGFIDEHLLVLLNGRPLRTSYATGYEHDVLFRNFPIDNVERIELIRGPGSVLYGSNAVEGVVNIITRKPTSDDGDLHHQVSALYGSDHKMVADYTVGKYLSDDGDYAQVSIRGHDYEGPRYRGSNSGTAYDQFLGTEDVTGVAEAKVGRWRANAYRTYSHHQEPGSADITTYKAGLFDIGYEYPIDDNWKANINTTMNWTDYTSGPSTNIITSHDMLFEGNISGSPFENTNLLLGATVNKQRSDATGATGTRKYSELWRSFYGQFDYRPIDDLKLIGGLQANSSRSGEYNFSPRVGAIYHINDKLGTKLLYATAFRSPTVNEKYLAPNPPFVSGGDPNIDDETTRTIDWQVFYDTHHYSLAATLYQTIQDDTITFAFGRTPNYQNSGKAKYRGIELEGKWQIDPNWHLQGSYVYQNNLISGVPDTFDVPNSVAKIGFDYNSLTGVRVGVFNSYFGDPSIDYSRRFNDNPAADTFNYLTANVALDVKQLWGSPAWPDTSLSFYGDNLLESDMIFYGGPADSDRTAPNFIGRSFFARLSVKF